MNQTETPEERARRLGVPYVKPIDRPKRYDLNPVIAICGGCGRDVHRMEGYCCPQSNCPIQPQATSWSNP